MNYLEKAIGIALQAHAGTIDKSGAPYILHPLRLMMSFKDQETMISAVLHDVVEDSSVTFEDLAEAGFSHHVLATQRLLTHTKDTPYMDYIKALAADPQARAIKLADLEDNMDITRIANPTEKDLKRIQRYTEAYSFLIAYK
jgi:(p)ppGpp synthase/HD superfamily hydrolase